MTQRFTIRELANEFDITTRTLRFYEEKGLLHPTRNNTTRSYSSGDRTRLRLILRGKRLGLTLEESSAIVLMYESNSKNTTQLQALIKKIRQKREQLLQQQNDLELMLLDLRDAEQQCLEELGALDSETSSLTS